MRTRNTLVLLFMLLIFGSNTIAQEQPSAADTAASMRLQLSQLQAKEEELRSRLEELDVALKPESIERALAGIGSTKPEELREHRRRMLTIQRDGVTAQLKTLAESRSRLESRISAAEADAYLESARPIPTPSTQMLMSIRPENARLAWKLVLPGIAIVTLLIGALTIAAVRRL